MTRSEQQMLRDFLSTRLDKAYKQLDYNPEYHEYSTRKNALERDVDIIFKKLERDEVRTVKQYFTQDSHRTFDENYEAYLQGLRDCINALAFLGVFNTEASI